MIKILTGEETGFEKLPQELKDLLQLYITNAIDPAVEALIGEGLTRESAAELVGDVWVVEGHETPEIVTIDNFSMGSIHLDVGVCNSLGNYVMLKGYVEPFAAKSIFLEKAMIADEQDLQDIEEYQDDPLWLHGKEEWDNAY